MEPFLGQIQAFGFKFAPKGWAFCNGQFLRISRYPALFSLLGTAYGGDGRATFGLPDLRGRVPIHYFPPISREDGRNLTPRSWGESGGAETTTLTTNQIPSHSHSVVIKALEEGNSDDPEGKLIAGNGLSSFGSDNSSTLKNLKPIITSNTGANQSHNNMQPFLCVNFCIALYGIFPSRN